MLTDLTVKLSLVTLKVPEGVSNAVTEVKKVPAITEQEVSSVEIDVSSFKHIPEQLLLRLDLVPGVTQELAHGCERSYQDPCLSCTWKIDLCSVDKPALHIQPCVTDRQN